MLAQHKSSAISAHTKEGSCFLKSNMTLKAKWDSHKLLVLV